MKIHDTIINNDNNKENSSNSEEREQEKKNKWLTVRSGSFVCFFVASGPPCAERVPGGSGVKDKVFNKANLWEYVKLLTKIASLITSNAGANLILCVLRYDCLSFTIMFM